MLIFSILNHPRSFLVYSSHFDVFLSYRTNILCFFPRVEVILHIAKNDANCGDVDPLTTKLAYYKHQLLCFAQGVGGGGGGATRSGTKKRYSHNLQSGQSAGLSATFQGSGLLSHDFNFGFEH